MKKNKLAFALITAVAIIIIGAGLSLFFSRFIDLRSIESKSVSIPQKTALQSPSPQQTTSAATTYAPPSPQGAPASIRDAVLLGANIMTDTGKYASQYVGNKLSCSNCHFKAGITQGGKNGGLSLVGVGASYPRYRKRQNYAVDLVTRTNDCFKRSMNGQPLPEESKEMTALVTYYQWISKGLPIYAEMPWLGLRHLESTHIPDKAVGAQVFEAKCSVCHGKNGEGTSAAPPLWGDTSFNDGAGMHKAPNLAAFSHFNMPLGNPDLSVENALDVAEYVTAQPRPHFSNKP